MAIVNLQFSPDQAQKLILIGVTVIVAAALVERYSGEKQTATLPQIFIGAFVVGALLLLLSYILPEFAVGLVAVAAVSMVVAKGQPFWDAINKVFKTPNPQTNAIATNPTLPSKASN